MFTGKAVNRLAITGGREKKTDRKNQRRWALVDRKKVLAATIATPVFGFTMSFLMVVVVVVVVVVVTLKQQKSALQQGIPEVARWLLTTTTATTTKNAMLESLARQGFSLSRW